MNRPPLDVWVLIISLIAMAASIIVILVILLFPDYVRHINLF